MRTGWSTPGELELTRARRAAGFTVVLLAGIVLTTGPARPAPHHVLMVSHSAGFEHEVVRRPGGGGLSIAERVVADLGRRSGRFDVTHVGTRDGPTNPPEFENVTCI